MQKYDKTFKEILENIPTKFLKLFTGYEQGKFLDIELPLVSSRKADFLVELPNKEIFHLEVQVSNDPLMPLRMMEYCTSIIRKYKRAPIQVVLYIGKEKLNMNNKLEGS